MSIFYTACMPTAVSVLIPAFNGARYLPETLDAILSQEYPAAEVIVLDDGSTDNTREVVAGFGGRVRYQYSDNGGICRARNRAAALAGSPYLAFCDQDDLWRRDKLAQQMQLHDSNGDLDYSFTNFSYLVKGVPSQRTKLDDAPADFFPAGLPAGNGPAIYRGSLYDSLLRFQPIWPSTVVIRREAFDRLGHFQEAFGKNPSEDLEWSLRCVQQGPVGVVRQPVVQVRQHGGNYSASSERNTRGQIEVLQYVLEHHTISQATMKEVLEQIDLRRVEASYGAFRRGDFEVVRSLLQPVPRSQLGRKSQLKLWVATQPPVLARLLHKMLLKA